MPTTAVIIPVYNRADLLIRTLGGLVAQSYPDFEVVVADDGSDEDVATAVEGFRESLRVQLVRRDRDGYGAGQARNLGAITAKSDVLIFIDADCLPDRELVVNHRRWHLDSSDRVVVGSRHHVDTSKLTVAELESGSAPLRQLAFGSDEPTSEQLTSPDFRQALHRRSGGLRRGGEEFRSLVSSNFSIRRDRFLEAGGFSEDFHRWGGEDTELGWRLFNQGLDFIPDDEAIIYHQTQVDAGPEGWRAASKLLNESLIGTKIPHRRYRLSKPGYIYEVPKVSVVVDPAFGPRIEDLWQQMLNQRLTDWELLVVDDGSPELVRLAENLRADSRFRVLSSGDQAVASSRGEYLAFLHGLAGLDHRLLSRSVKRLEDRPRAPLVKVAYAVPVANGLEVHRRLEDITRIDQAWGAVHFAMTRRRLLIMSGGLAEHGNEAEVLTEPLVVLAGRDQPPTVIPTTVARLTSDRSLLAEEARKGPRAVTSALPRFLGSRVRGMSFRTPVAAPSVKDSPAPDRPVEARYIGWNGYHNLGDEAMLAVTKDLMPWAEISTSGLAKHLLILGGGTLINRNYLRQLIEHDSPRVERVVFGTGVANPSYWGTPKEPDGWVEFLNTCGFVGLRGPISLELLRGFGFKGRAEVIGDPALALIPPPTDRQPGRVVISPAFARGELWGGNDQAVFDAIAGVVPRLLAEGREICFLSCFPADDRHIFEIMRRAGTPDLTYLAGYDATEPALQLLASAEVVVAERLHAAVLAAAAGTPFIPLEYRPKLADFSRSVEMDTYVIRTDQLTPDTLWTRLQLLKGDQEASGRISSAVEEYRRRLHDAASEVEGLMRRPEG